MKPSVSYIFPVYNEAESLESGVARLAGCLDRLGRDYELILVENGSRDATAALAESLCARDGRLRCLRLPASDRSDAMKLGLREARGERIVLADIDHYDLTFFGRALDELDRAERRIVVGSKHAAGSRDGRPSFRQWVSRFFNGALRRLFGWPFSDVHGPKAVRRRDLDPRGLDSSLPVDVALLALAHRSGLQGVEIPIVVAEIRPPRKPGIRQFFFILKVLCLSTLFVLRRSNERP